MFEGQQITPTLRLVRVLGNGGMGSVWIADHLALRTQVAVKFMDAALAHSASFVRRFQSEAVAAAAIKSPHVVQVFDHGITAEQEPYIVMELLEGEDLRARLRRTGPLTPAALAPIVSQVAKALSLAHELRIVHRDIKPANVFLMKHGDEVFVKVLDFGIAKVADDLAAGPNTNTGSVMGTAPYMSPEQLVGAAAVDYRADLWALAVVVYKALTGALPFNGPTLGAVTIAVNAGTFTLPTEARPALSSAIDGWMQRALAREPSDRFASAREMADAFERAAGAPMPEEHAAIRPVDVAAAADLTLAGATRTKAGTVGRRAPFLLAAVLLLASAGVYAARAARTRPETPPAARAQNESPKPEPATLGAPARPAATEAAPRPSSAAINLNDLPSTPPSASSAPRRRPALVAAGARPKATAAEGTPEAPPTPAAAPPTPPPAEAPGEPESDGVSRACARCSKN